ncbi:MAG: phage holin family protein [Novosphingobium sp.]|nr:phage holin family protein [Novosphingobium sp.]
MRLIAGQVRTFAEAELAFQKARAAYAGSAAKTIALLGVIAAVFLFFAAMAAVFGTVIALGPSLGLWGAMAAVTLGLFLLAGICAAAAAAKAKRMKTVLSERVGDAERG